MTNFAAIGLLIFSISCGRQDTNGQATDQIESQLPTEQETENLKDKLEKQATYLDKHVFYGLTNLNDGFDAVSIKYFSEEDFKIVLDRIKELGLGITGIEPWKDGEFYDVVTYEMVTDDPTNSDWYMKAYEDFKKDGENLQYAASYSVPDRLLNEKK